MRSLKTKRVLMESFHNLKQRRPLEPGGRETMHESWPGGFCKVVVSLGASPEGLVTESEVSLDSRMLDGYNYVPSFK